MIVLQRVTGVLKIVGVLVVGTAGAYGVKRLLKPCTLYISFDRCIAADARAALKKNIVPELLRDQGAQGLQQKLIKLFPALRAVTIAYNGSRTARVDLKAYQPVLSVISIKSKETAGVYCATVDGQLVPRDLFKFQVVEELPVIFIDSCSALDSFKSCLQHEVLPILGSAGVLAVFKKYKVTWHSKNKIVLSSYVHPNLYILADCAALKTKKLEYAERIYKSRQEKEGALTIDIRLGDFIVCAHLKGGGK